MIGKINRRLLSQTVMRLLRSIQDRIKTEPIRKIISSQDLSSKVAKFCELVGADKSVNLLNLDLRSIQLRRLVRSAAGLSPDVPGLLENANLIEELRFTQDAAAILKPAFDLLLDRRVLFCGQAYYNTWYISRQLKKNGWKADVFNWDTNPKTQIYYHGEDFLLGGNVPNKIEDQLNFYLTSLYNYDIFHFSNANGITFGGSLESVLLSCSGQHAEIYLLKSLGKKIVYSNNGCLDGVSQSAFSMWGPESVCSICRWQNEPLVCSDERNLEWGRFRNEVADFQCLLGGNRVDFNDDPRVHEVPEFYCLSPEIWRPDIPIPNCYLLPSKKKNSVRLYHAVGQKTERTRSDGVNIKSTHIYLPLIEKLRAVGMNIDLIEPVDVPNKEIRFLQAQADIFLDMLTFGWFGANAREAMMLAKPVICFIRTEWLDSLRKEIPEYAEELPIVSATPQTVEEVLKDLIANSEKRMEIGRRGREFALKWHSDSAAGKRFNEIYSQLLAGDPLLRPMPRALISKL